MFRSADGDRRDYTYHVLKSSLYHDMFNLRVEKRNQELLNTASPFTQAFAP